MSRKLYCECGGLIKCKPREIRKKQRPTTTMDYIKEAYHLTQTSVVNYYVCSKCGKKHN